MTLITIINGVCDVVALDRFSSVYSNPGAQMLLKLAKLGGDEIARRVDWRDMLKTSTLASSPSAFQSDFQRMVPGGGIFTADGTPARPSTNSGEFAMVKAVGSAQPYFFADPSGMQFSPPSAAVGATMLYVSKNWVKSGAAEKDDFSSDSDTLLFPEKLLEKDVIWRYRRQKRLAYDDELAEFEADLATEIKANRGIA